MTSSYGHSSRPDFEKAEITAQNSFTGWMPLQAGERASVSITGTWAATVVLQRRLPDGTVADVPNPDDTVGWTANTQKSYEADERQDIRLGVKTGDFTSGTVVARIGKG